MTDSHNGLLIDSFAYVKVKYYSLESVLFLMTILCLTTIIYGIY